MSTKGLPSLAHALGVAPDLEAALVALGESLAEIDRFAVVALLRYDPRRSMLQERLTPVGERVTRQLVETTIDHLPATVRAMAGRGGQFVELGDRSTEVARLLGLTPFADGGFLTVRGLLTDGELSALLALYEQRRMFGTRTSERLAPAVALFDLAYARFGESEARQEAVRTLEDVTQRVHGEYVRKLSALEGQLPLDRDAGGAAQAPAETARRLQMERELASAQEDARRASHRAAAAEQQVAATSAQLEQAHAELHRRNESMRQKTRTLHLVERALVIDNTSHDDPRQLVDGLLGLVGDDMQAQRCSLMLRAPEPETLYLAAARGLAPNIIFGARIPYGKGVAGIVARSREPLLVQDAAEADRHPLLRDQFLTTGSFISFPLVYRDDLVGVVNLTNRAKRGVFVEEDVERVALLALVVALIATNARLPERLLAELAGR